MINNIENPLAIAVVTWLTAEEGGRRSWPPTAEVYAATCVFRLGGDAEVSPGWPAGGDALSILLQPVEPGGHGSGAHYKVDFLARDLARPFLRPAADLLVMEGPKVVGEATITEVFDIDSEQP